MDETRVCLNWCTNKHVLPGMFVMPLIVYTLYACIQVTTVLYIQVGYVLVQRHMLVRTYLYMPEVQWPSSSMGHRYEAKSFGRN